MVHSSSCFKGDASKISDPVIKHIAQKGKQATIANIQTAASILGYKDYKNVSKWSSAQKNALVKKLQSYGFANGGIIRELIPASMGTLLGDAIMKMVIPDSLVPSREKRCLQRNLPIC